MIPIICEACFIEENHLGHEFYLETLSEEGKCDCGNLEAFSKEAFCHKHIGLSKKNQNLTETAENMFKKNFAPKIKNLLYRNFFPFIGMYFQPLFRVFLSEEYAFSLFSENWKLICTKQFRKNWENDYHKDSNNLIIWQRKIECQIIEEMRIAGEFLNLEHLVGLHVPGRASCSKLINLRKFKILIRKKKEEEEQEKMLMNRKKRVVSAGSNKVKSDFKKWENIYSKRRGFIFIFKNIF